MSKHMKCPK